MVSTEEKDLRSEHINENSLGPQQEKSKRARNAIMESTIRSLVEVGYSETSLVRVAKAAGFSKGAIQHHYPSKEDLIAQTLDNLISRTFSQSPKTRRPKSVDKALLRAWDNFVDTPPYRALLEILNAARTDKKLKKRIGKELVAWRDRMDLQSIENYEAVNGDDEDVVMLLNMNRSFMRGLLLQEQYGFSHETTIKYLHKWVEMLSPLLRLKEKP